MSSGSRIAAQGMNALMLQHDIVTNNLANVNTAGYKSDALTVSSFQSIFNEKLGLQGGGVNVTGTVPRLEQGILMKTGNALNAALSGKGFFVVTTPDGERYTRNGSFSVNDNNELVNGEGYPVMGEGGSLTIDGTNIEINQLGMIIVDGESVGTLRVVDVENNNDLLKQGANLFKLKDEETAVLPKPEETKVMGGHLESSDVNPIRQMVEMIEIMRSFDAHQKVISSFSEINKSAIKVGQV